jgi:hypothetical protein
VVHYKTRRRSSGSLVRPEPPAVLAAGDPDRQQLLGDS